MITIPLVGFFLMQHQVLTLFPRFLRVPSCRFLGAIPGLLQLL